MAFRRITYYPEASAEELSPASWLLVQIGAAFFKASAGSIAAREEWIVKAADFDAVAGVRYQVDTSGGVVTATLPPPSDIVEGDVFLFTDSEDTWGTNKLMVDPNGNEFIDLGGGGNPLEPLNVVDDGLTFFLVFKNGKLRPRT